MFAGHLPCFYHTSTQWKDAMRNFAYNRAYSGVSHYTPRNVMENSDEENTKIVNSVQYAYQWITFKKENPNKCIADFHVGRILELSDLRREDREGDEQCRKSRWV